MTIDEAETKLGEARAAWIAAMKSGAERKEADMLWEAYSAAFDDFRRACFNRENWKKPEEEHSAAHNDGETVEGLGDA